MRTAVAVTALYAFAISASFALALAGEPSSVWIWSQLGFF